MDTNAPITEDLKNKIYTSLADALIGGLENNSLTLEDSETSSQYILNCLETITTQDQLLAFLDDVSARWPTYKETYLMVKQQESEKVDNQQIQEAREQLQNAT